MKTGDLVVRGFAVTIPVLCYHDKNRVVEGHTRYCSALRDSSLRPAEYSINYRPSPQEEPAGGQ